jgi:outer membrane protein W
MRLAIFAGLVAVSLAASSTALADGATASGIEVGLRAGYSIPLGNLDGGNGTTANKLSDLVSGRIPIWIDAGYRINPNMYVGAFFQYGLGSVSSSGGLSTECSQNGVSCSIHDLEFGAMFAYHLMPDQTIDPWLGIGVGYETLSFSASAGGQSVDASASGFQFANLQLGADYKAMPNLGIGPFVSFSLGQYSSESSGGVSNPNLQTSMHEWLTFGIRGVYDINLQ